MKNLFKILAVFLFLPAIAFAQDEAPEVKALVGGTLIDGFSSTPIQNSVIIIEGDTIVASADCARVSVYAREQT